MISKQLDKKKIKVAFIVLPEILFEAGELVRSGSVIVNEQIINALRSDGLEVICFAPINKEKIALRKKIGFGNTLMFQDLARVADKINACDVVITTNYFGEIIPEITRPVITIFHHSAKTLLRAICEQKVTRDKIFKKWSKRSEEFRLSIIENEENHAQIASVIEQSVVDRSDCVVAVSEKMRNEITANYSCAGKNIVVINNSVPSKWQDAELKKDFSTIVITSVTRMPGSDTGFYMKGIDRIIEAFSEIETSAKSLVASTSYSLEYKQFFSKYLPLLDLKLNLSHDQVRQHLEQSNVTLHCSRIESFGLTLVESMATGNVPISFDEGVANEIIENGKNGFIVSGVEEMVKIANYLITKPDQVKKMSSAAYKTVNAKLSSQVFDKKYVDLVRNFTLAIKE